MVNKRKLKSAVILALSVVIIFELGYICIRKGRGIFGLDGAELTLSYSASSVKINNQDVPVYTVSGSDSLYVSEDVLNACGCGIIENTDSYGIEYTDGAVSPDETGFSNLSGYTVTEDEKKLLAEDELYTVYNVNNMLAVPTDALSSVGSSMYSDNTKTLYIAIGTDEEIAAIISESYAEINGEDGGDSNNEGENRAEVTLSPRSGSSAGASSSNGSKIIVLDPGHGASSSGMSAAELAAEGYVQNSSGAWGEWRHWKSGTSDEPCEGSGCTGRVPSGGSCWYAVGNGDRNTEPEINLANALAAKKYLEQMGYTVRMTRDSNDTHPSFSKRISYCYPNNDLSSDADASLYVCIHSNAGGGRGTAYITLEGEYDQRGISSTYVEDSNRAGKTINDSIAENTSLSLSGSGTITFEPELIAFCKSPIPVAYLEIGFFDSTSDLAILRSESDAIGKAIAEGIEEYF